MYAARLVRSSTKLFSSNVLSKLSSINNQLIFRNCCRKKYTSSFDIQTKVNADVVLFKINKTKFLSVMNILAGCQFFFWGYISVFLYQSLKKPNLTEQEKSFWKNFLKDFKYTNILMAVSFSFGLITFISTCFYTIRSIKQITLHKGGKNLTIVTHWLPGFKNTYHIPLRMVSCSQHRSQAKKYIPLKMKDKYFHYLIDKEGKFNNPELFDFTVGISRNF